MGSEVKLKTTTCFLDNLGWNIVCKFPKLSKIGFSIEYFTADFLKFSWTNLKTWLLGVQLGTCHQFQNFQRLSWNFYGRKSNVGWQLVRQLTQSSFSDNNLVLPHLWRKKTLVKPEKVYRYFVHGCKCIYVSINQLINLGNLGSIYIIDLC